MSLEQPRSYEMEELQTGPGEPSEQPQSQETAAGSGQDLELTFDPSDPVQLQNALETVCVDRGD
jgi:hypothetical protein